jgi:heavy metal translocating P-type ATPase
VADVPLSREETVTTVAPQGTAASALAARQARIALICIALGGVLLGAMAHVLGRSTLAHWLWIAGTVPVVAGLAWNSARDLLGGRMGIDAIALISMSAALVLGEPLAANIVAVMYAGGSLLEDFAVRRAERDLRALVDRAPRIAHRRQADAISDVTVDAVASGDTLLVRSGEVIPVDGMIYVVGPAGAVIDASVLTGEPLPVTLRAGDVVYSGTINAGDTFEMRATAVSSQSAYAGIVRLVTAAQTAKAPFMRLADRFALLLLPVTLVLAGAAWQWSGDPIRGLAVLVAATPCPLILAAPIAFISGVARAARRGILVKGGGPLEALAHTHTVMFDKTGTLTVGGARLIGIETRPGVEPDEVLRLAASLEQASPHVVATAIVAAARSKGFALQMPIDVQEDHGAGLSGNIDGKRVTVGSQTHVDGIRQPEGWAHRAQRRASWRSALSVFVAVDGRTIGALLLGDEIRREMPRALQSLRAAGVRRIVMVTGDRAEAAETIAAALDLDAVLADRVPADKVKAVATEQRRHSTVMVGDGINDAPALATASVGIAMGARGASASSEAADVIILVDRLDRVAEALVIARRTRRIAMQSIVIGMALSGCAMLAAAFGWLSPIAGALSQEAIDVAVIFNALRALGPGLRIGRSRMPTDALAELDLGHKSLDITLDRLRAIADALDDASPERAACLISEAAGLVGRNVAKHEQDDETIVYPKLSVYLPDGHGLGAMSRAHREIRHQTRLLARIASGLSGPEIDRYMIRDAQRVIEAVEALVRLHSAQEADIYEHAAGL